MHNLPILKPGDHVEIIAPGSRCSDKQLADLKKLLLSWQLHCIVDDAIFGPDLLCANTDEMRFKLLKNALERPETKAIICARGGYGSMRLIPPLSNVSPVFPPKLFVGMSDITALHLYLQQQWQWPTIHGSLTSDNVSNESIAALKSLLFGENCPIEFSCLPLNALAEKKQSIEAHITGGNLCLVQTSIGTMWQMQGKNKIIFLEEVNERAYRIDRMLEQLHQAASVHDAAAILFGDFTGGDEPDGSSLIAPVLARFAERCAIPVVQVKGIGHGYVNFPLILGAKATLQLGDRIRLSRPR